MMRSPFHPSSTRLDNIPLVKTAVRSVHHMQKAFDQMNVHLHHAISDLTGHSGLAITDAILAGERDPACLAALAHPRIRASRDTLIKALEGDWRDELLFTLRHARQTYAHYRRRSSAPLRYRSTGPPVPARLPLSSPSSRSCCATGSRCARFGAVWPTVGRCR